MTGARPELSVVLPCLNEARTVGHCVDRAASALRRLGIDGEIVVADNGSTDDSRRLAREAGATVVEVPERGYGAALRAGIRAARGRFVLIADADDSYDLDAIEPFVRALRAGNDLVMGNRFAGGIAHGAMPALHRYVGNPVLSFLGRLFFSIPVRDFHCGMRAFDRDKAVALHLRSPGMEFASELVVRFALSGHRIAEVPTALRPDGRDRAPHLRSWRDGWRHLRFLLLFSPRWLFLYPGLVLTGFGAALTIRLSFGPLSISGAVLDTQSLLFAGAAVVVGAQSLLFGLLARTYARARGLLPPGSSPDRTAHPSALEHGALLGGGLALLGLVGAASAVLHWATRGFGPLELAHTMRLAIPSATCLAVGGQILTASFFLGLLHFDDELDRLSPAPESSSSRADR